MRPFDPRLKFGIPAAAGLGAAAYGAMDDGVTPLEAVGAGLGAGAGAAGGLVGARALAGKYGGALPAALTRGLDAPRGKSKASIRERTEQAIRRSPEYRERGPSQTLYAPETLGNTMRTAILEAPATMEAAAQAGMTAGLVPAAAASAALGGMAVGQGVGAVGQMMGIDPELPGSSNTVNSRLSMQSAMLPMY